MDVFGRPTSPSLLALLVTLFLHTASGAGRAGGHGVWKRASLEVGFTEGVDNQTVVVGRNATLRCSVENLGDYKIAWVKADSQTLLSIANTMITRNYRARVSNSDNSTWFLHINNVRLADRGYYMCQINTVPMVFKQGYLEVVVPPNILDEETSADVEVNEDSSVQLRCAADGYPAPEIIFKREDSKHIPIGNGNVKASSETESVEEVKRTTGILSFKAVKRTDMGHYLCIASNTVPPSVSKRVVLNVRYREPEVEVNLQMIGVYRGDDVAINCTVTAYPRPVVLWQDSFGKMIISGGRYEVVEKLLRESPPVIQTSLIIKSLQPEDITSYRCNASIDNDKMKEKSVTVQLNEIIRPSTESSFSQDIHYKAPRQRMTPKKSLSKHSRVNDIAERYEKPTSFVPGTYLHPNIGHVNSDDPSSASGIGQSRCSSSRLVFVLVGWGMLCQALRGRA
ncbi:protein amalgam isoform X1 [Penaeus vannamei]